MCRPTSRTKKQMPTSSNQNSQSRRPSEGLTLVTRRLVKGCVNSDANVSLTKVCLGPTLKTGPSFSEELKTPASQGFSKPWNNECIFSSNIPQSSILIVLGYSETIVLQMGMSQSHFTTQFWKEFLEKSTIYFAKFKKEFPMELALTS